VTDITVQLGLPEHLRADAARLYWQAFGGKLGPVMGPQDRAMRFLIRVIRADQVIIACNNHGQLVGIAGFKTARGSFASGQAQDMSAVYGLIGSFWRRLLLEGLSDGVDNDHFLLDGLCVDASARSQGVGTALMKAICAEANSRGYSSVRLDVIDSNQRAVELYKRLGFNVTARQSIGPLRWVFGFDAAFTMVKSV
jgi:ribosomal protein S18 acetylase RimI-like enzyme